MMKKIKLAKRLQALADCVPAGTAVADIGTDHGYIPIYLIQNRITDYVIASDIRPGPLTSARRSAEAYGVLDRIEFVQADGLTGITPGDVQTVLISGMGGETIRDILLAAVWTKRGVHLILQPQSKYALLCKWLGENGYVLVGGRLVQDDGRIYQIMLVEGCGSSSMCALDWQQDYIISVLMKQRDPLLPVFLDELIVQYRRRIAGMEKAVHTVQWAELLTLKKALDEWIELKGETLQWQR
jgi:tRNA (adenine22-N1)-methyltransferase